jgi:hypothetical protein
MIEYFRDVCAWMLAVLTKWHGWLGGSAVMGLLALLQALKVWEYPSYKIYVSLLCLGFLVSTFEAWREEYAPNRSGPRIMLEWISKSSSTHMGGDIVRFMNCGRSLAVNISMKNFSLPEMGLFKFKDLQSLEPGDHVVISVNLVIERAANDHLGTSMSRFLLEHGLNENPTPVTVEVSFSDINQTNFIQTFELSSQDTKDSEVMVDPVRLKVRRH